MANPVRCGRASNALQSVFFSTIRSCDAATLPGFLVPAYASRRAPTVASRFSTTAAPRSKIGRAPLSIPPEVTFNVASMPQQQQQRMNLSSEVGSKVEIEGPRGKTSVIVPPYICITESEGGRMQALTVRNAEERRQREMWGEYNFPSIARGCKMCVCGVSYSMPPASRTNLARDPLTTLPQD